MTNEDRAALVELLDRLGSSDDATVLEAARALHRKAAESGLSWDELLRLGQDDHETVAEDSDEGQEAPAASPDAADTVRLIDRLLRKGVSDNLREDLIEMKRQLGDGELDQGDRRYLRALAKRLGV